MESMTVTEAANEWGITECHVLALCNAGRVRVLKNLVGVGQYH
jgi:hypothetical protein